MTAADRKWFNNKEVIFAYPVEVVDNTSRVAVVNRLSEEMFSYDYELLGPGNNHVERKDVNLSSCDDFDTDRCIVAYNRQDAGFIIDLPINSRFSNDVCMNLLSTFGKDIHITYSDNFGDSYVPIYTLSCKRIPELQAQPTRKETVCSREEV